MDSGIFDRDWLRADLNKQIEWVSKAVEMPMADGVKTVMAGLTSFHFSIRSKAEYALGILQRNIISNLKGKDKKQGLLDSALLSVHVYKNINENISAEDRNLYFKILLESGGRGPFYVWKLFQSKMFSIQTIKNTINSLPSSCRLALVNQYLASTPSVRREYAEHFLQMLKDFEEQKEDYKVNQKDAQKDKEKKKNKYEDNQKAVIQFYANLFDMEIPADIFLDNLSKDFRNPDTILKFIAKKDQSDSDKADALKAVAMLSPIIKPSLLLKIIKMEGVPQLRKTAFKIIERSPLGSYTRLIENIMNILCDYKCLPKFDKAMNKLNEPMDQRDEFMDQRNEPIDQRDQFMAQRDEPIDQRNEPMNKLNEAMDIFKAVVMCRQKKQFLRLKTLEQQFTLEGLIQRVNKEIPELMPLILNEIDSFSKFAFCFIEDMAEDPSANLFQNTEIEHALICGMIRKRPERVLKIFETYINHPVADIKVALTQLIEKINLSLAEEKNELKRQFDQLIETTTPVTRKKEKRNFFKNLFSASLDQKIARLKDSNSPSGVDLSEESIEGVDLSSCDFLSPGIFKGCIIRNVDFSGSKFQNCSFKNSFFYNVKMSETLFYDTSFEQSVFIDVTADGAKFQRCNFAGASFLNSNFKSSDMTEAILAGCNIAKTSFSETDLSGATFVGSQITMVSFADSKLEKTDFSGVTGKFCRFSAHILSRAETEQADLYSRIIEISHTDISKELLVISQDKSLMNEIRMLIFTELIQQGKNIFLIKNRYSIIAAFDLFQPDQADLFELIPLLLHENIDLYIPSARSTTLAKLVEFDKKLKRGGKPAGIQKYDIPNGIAGYLPNSETQKIYDKYRQKKYLYKDGIIFIERPFCYIEALFTMGSIGSIAHTMGSDIDYWVCIREELFDSDKLIMLRKKLDLIETWAKDVFRTEIHFFIVDIAKAKQSDFGNSDSESSGSAQGRLLKEEFYRTMIYVAGKLPFWATLPVEVSKIYYHDLLIRVCPNPSKGRFIDFGDIHDIPAGEYFGASVWQMLKYLKSPFKSVLKMGLLEKYIKEEKSARILLCNEFKNEWMNPGLAFNLTKSDPYYILLSSLVIYYKKIDFEHPFAKFVQSCFFSKVNITDEKELKKSAFGLKEILIRRCMDEWEWKTNEVFEAGDFKNWPYEKIFSESVKIKQYMVKTYNECRIIWTSLDSTSEKDSLLTTRDRTVLGRKMIVQFSMDAKAKIETLLLVSKSGLSNGLSILYSDESKNNEKWYLIHKLSNKVGGFDDIKDGRKDDIKDGKKNEILKKAPCIEEIGAWLIHNQLYVRENYITLLPNPTFVTVNDINLLFKAMYDFFADNIKREINNDALCKKSIINSMFISINFTAPRDSNIITEWSVICRNSWGEMFCHLFTDPTGLRTSSDVINRIKQDFEILVIPETHKIFSPSQLRIIN